MSQQDKINQWIKQATQLAQETNRPELLPIFGQIARETAADTLPPVQNRATGLLAPYIYQRPVEGELGKLINELYYFFQLLPDGYNWSWQEVDLAGKPLPTGLIVSAAYLVDTTEVISVGVDRLSAETPAPQSDGYDDSLFNIERILTKVARDWYVLYDASSSEYIPDAVSQHEVIFVLETADADVRLCKLDFRDQDLMWALVQEYELGDGIALLHFDAPDIPKLKTWLLDMYTSLYDGDLEIDDVIRPTSLAEILGEPDLSVQVRNLFGIVSLIALRFDTNPDEFVIYRQQPQAR